MACIEPVAYLEFLSLQAGAGAIVTDSGGVQEEASALGVSCFTFRPNTERPITLTHGTNVLLGEDPAEIAEVRPSTHPPTPCAIPLWDGHAGERVADALVANYVLKRGSAGAAALILVEHEERTAWRPESTTAAGCHGRLDDAPRGNRRYDEQLAIGIQLT